MKLIHDMLVYTVKFYQTHP